MSVFFSLCVRLAVSLLGPWPEKKQNQNTKNQIASITKKKEKKEGRSNDDEMTTKEERKREKTLQPKQQQKNSIEIDKPLTKRT